MNSNMFCFQCEQTSNGTGCTSESGVCGKRAETAKLQDKLTGALITLATVLYENPGKKSEKTEKLVLEALFATITNVNFDNKVISKLIEETEKEIKHCSSGCQLCKSVFSSHKIFDIETIWNEKDDIRSLKSLILFGLRGMGAYAYHAMVLGFSDSETINFIIKALQSLGKNLSTNDFIALVLEVGKYNLKTIKLLDKANTSTFGKPLPTEVSMKVDKGPFIVVSGHDLRDLQEILEQTKDKGINVYTHGEMLPAHSYPILKNFTHLKGHFGTAWQNQQYEFEHLPAPILFTTNCIMKPKTSYADRVFTSGPVFYPDVKHISTKPYIETQEESYKNKNVEIKYTQITEHSKDFSPVIDKALELGGYPRDTEHFGINGGSVLSTGFAHDTVLSVADTLVNALDSGKIKHIFLVGGCDGAKIGRNYYTDFVKETPKDSIILTMGCGKFRFNDLELGTVAGLPRLMDMGQCNDAYSAIKVAEVLADHYKCTINDLPITFVLSWFEQKAVAVFITLLYLGIQDIYLGPSLPAFISSNLLAYLIDNYNIHPTTNPKKDLEKMLK